MPQFTNEEIAEIQKQNLFLLSLKAPRFITFKSVILTYLLEKNKNSIVVMKKQFELKYNAFVFKLSVMPANETERRKSKNKLAEYLKVQLADFENKCSKELLQEHKKDAEQWLSEWDNYTLDLAEKCRLESINELEFELSTISAERTELRNLYQHYIEKLKPQKKLQIHSCIQLLPKDSFYNLFVFSSETPKHEKDFQHFTLNEKETKSFVRQGINGLPVYHFALIYLINNVFNLKQGAAFSRKLSREQLAEIEATYTDSYNKSVAEFEKSYPNPIDYLDCIKGSYNSLEDFLMHFRTYNVRTLTIRSIKDFGTTAGIYTKLNIYRELLNESKESNGEIKKFKSELSDDCLINIMHLLVKQKELPSTDVDLWLYWFNRKSINNTTQLIWSGTPTMLANVMSTICGTYQRIAAKVAIKDWKDASVSMSGRRKADLIKEIEQKITISKQTKP